MSGVRLARKARLRFDRHAGSFVLLGPERGLVLNPSAAAIVRLCDGRPVDAIVEAIGAGVQAAERERAEADVRSFVLDMIARRMLVEA